MKIPFFKSLRFRMPLTLVMCGVIPPVLIGLGFASFRATKTIHNDIEENIELEAEKLQTGVSRWNRMNALALQNLSKQPGVVSLNTQQQKPNLENILETYDHLYIAHTVDLNGTNIARSDDKPANNYQDRAWFKGAIAGNEVTYQTLISRTWSKPAACMSTPIEQQQVMGGVLTICSFLDDVTEQVAQVSLGETGSAIIVDNLGQVVAHTNPEFTTGESLVDLSDYPPVANVMTGNEGSFVFVDDAGVESIANGKLLDNGWAAITLQHTSEAFAPERQFVQIAVLSGIFIVAITGILTSLIASRTAKPISKLTDFSLKVAEGDFSDTVKSDRDDEIGLLADSFNTMARQLQTSIAGVEAKAEEQRQQRERLEREIYTLIEEVSDATEGDLTVRAKLNSMELGTVADLFNAIIDNLQAIAIEAKQSTGQVGSALQQNEAAIRALAEQAIAEAQETRDTLKSVALMSQSIQEVAENADRAEQIADDTYNTVVDSTNSMDSTVNSILALRTIVGDTAKKMQSLGESSQKITQAVSFIEEIAVKTNVLAINASVEADRVGEYGQGFTIIAQQVGALAEQCATATKEIASIVTAIQAETQEVNQALESGTTQVTETTRLVETTKQSLSLVLEKSQAINQLMGSISQTTVSQANTSQDVTTLMQKIAKLSATTSKSSQEVAESIIATTQVAQKLESAVAQFKVAQSS